MYSLPCSIIVAGSCRNMLLKDEGSWLWSRWKEDFFVFIKDNIFFTRKSRKVILYVLIYFLINDISRHIKHYG